MPTSVLVDAPALRDWMTANGWSVRTLALALDINWRTVSRYRSGTATIPRTVELALQSLGPRQAPPTEPTREPFEG